MLVSRFNLRLYNVDNAFHRLPQRQLIHIQRQFAALYLGHIQHVVDKPKQMLAGKGYLSQAVMHLLHIVHIGHGNRRHSHDAVHRCADIMAHIGKELTLGLARLICLIFCLFQHSHLMSGYFIVQDKHNQYADKHGTAGKQHGAGTLAAKMRNRRIQYTVWHNAHQIP